MKYIELILRIVLAVSMGYLGAIIATELIDVEVTAPGLTMAATLIVMIAILNKALHRFITSERLNEQTIVDAAASPATLRARPVKLHRDRDKRARHEAAHAVVAHALGHRVISTSITTHHGSGGRVAWQHNGFLMASEDHVAVAFAGPLAEQTGDVVLDTDDGR